MASTERGDELGDAQPHDVGGLVQVRDDAAHLRPGQPAGHQAETERGLVAVHDVHIQVHRDLARPGPGQPVQQRAGALAQIRRGEGAQTPLVEVGEGVLLAVVQPGQGHPRGIHRRRQPVQDLRVSLPDDRGDGHRVIAVVAGVRGVDVRVGVDPHHREVLPVAAGQLGEGDDAHRALPAEVEDARRVPVPGQDLLGGVEGGEDLLAGLDAARGARLLLRDRDHLGGSVVLGQHGLEEAGAQGVAAAGPIQRRFGQQLAHHLLPGPLPLRPDQAQGAALLPGGVGRGCASGAHGFSSVCSGASPGTTGPPLRMFRTAPAAGQRIPGMPEGITVIPGRFA